MANIPDCRRPTAHRPLVLRARIVLPVAGPPIENGAVLIFRDRVVVVAGWPDFPREFAEIGQIHDLGEVVLLPGLVNAHCHLDYTDMAGMWPPPKKFTDWIPRMLAAKAEWSYSDYARSWLHGAEMLVHSGTTTVADIESAPELLPDVWESTPLRVFSFIELTGVRSKRDPADILGEAMEKIDSLGTSRCLAALSPHAPYSTSPELLRLCAQTAKEKNLLLAVHVAESEQEFEMFTHGRGEMHDWLKRNGRDNSDCGHGSPFQHVDRAGLLNDNFLAIHANYIEDNDFQLFPGKKFSIVHCPRSHQYFNHREFPLEKLLQANVNVCLGTDSLATITKNDKQDIDLSMFPEMQLLLRAHPGISPEQILKMSTVNGALALGFKGRIGEISGGSFADLIAIPFAGKVSDAAAAIVNFSGRVKVSMIGGQWMIAP